VRQPSFWVFDELPSGDDYPSSDTSQFGSILVFWGFWVDYVWGKRWCQLFGNDWKPELTEIYKIEGSIG